MSCSFTAVANLSSDPPAAVLRGGRKKHGLNRRTWTDDEVSPRGKELIKEVGHTRIDNEYELSEQRGRLRKGAGWFIIAIITYSVEST